MKHRPIWLRTAAVTLASVLLLAGCSQGGTSSAGGGSGSGSQSQAEQNGSQGGQKNPPTEFTIMLRNTEGLDIDKLNQHPVIEAMREQSNANFTIFAPSKDADDYATKVQLAFAGGDYPEIYEKPDGNTDTDLMDSGIILPLDDLLKENAPELLATLDETAIRRLSYNGKLYGIQGRNQYGRHDRVTFVRKDWLDKLGMEMPTNLDEFTAFARAIKATDLNGNGQNDEIPIGARKGYKWMPFEMLFGCDTTLEWALEDGELKPIWATQAMKDCMTYQRQLYDEGLIYKEALTDDSVKEKRDAGLVGIYYHMPMSGISLNNSLEVEGGEWAPMPWFGAPGVEQFGAQNHAYTRTFYITKAAKDPAGIVRFLNWMLTDEAQQLITYGVEGYNWTADANGNMVYDITKDPDNDVGSSGAKWRPYFLRFVTPGAMDEAEITNFYGDDGKWLLDSIVASDHGGAGMDKITDGMPTIPIYQQRPDLAKVFDEARVQILIGEKPVEYIDELYADWKSRGGEEALAFVNEWYQNNK